MAESITKDDLQQAITQAITQVIDRVDELESSMDGSFQNVYDTLELLEEQTEKLAALVKSEFEERDARFDRIESQLKEMEAPSARLRAIELRLDKLEERTSAA